MNTTPETDTTATAGNGVSFDPQQAAALLDQTTQQTRRRTEPFPAWLVTLRAFIALIIYGAVWLSVRNQHPYHHPTAAVIPVAIVLGLANFVAVVTVARRATAGVSGKTRLRPAETAIALILWVGVAVTMTVMASNGVSDSIVYGTFPVAVPLIAAGLFWAAAMAARANWLTCIVATVTAVVGVIAVFAGPAGAWAVASVGVFIVMMTRAAVIAGRQRRSVVRS
jgi:hypothetical protein